MFVLFGIYLAFGLGCYRQDLVLRLHLVPSRKHAIESILWYLAHATAWPLFLYLEHQATHEMMLTAIERAKERAG